MKLLNNANTFSMSEENQAKKIEIEFTGKICQILSSSLYQYKEEAIVRELCCNANDAYDIDAIDKKYDVHVPSVTEPYFYVRDYATGMSPEDIDNVYAYFGRSTKEHSNDFTGCLGIGSKSPFAYVRNFFVVSYYQGVKYSYNIFKNESGEPQYTKMNECRTDEPDGLKVQFAVQNYDIYKFKNAIKNILKFFDNPPVLLNSDFQLEKLSISHSFNNFDVLSSNYYFHDSTRLIKMGNIVYDLDHFYRKLNIEDDDSDEVIIHRFLSMFSNQNRSVIFKAPIGLFDFNPSRENISLDEQSFKNIKEFLLQSIEELKQELSIRINELDNEPNYLSALIEYNKFSVFKGFDDSESTGKFYKDDRDFPYVRHVDIRPCVARCYYKKKRGKKYVIKKTVRNLLNVNVLSEDKSIIRATSSSTYVMNRIRKFLLDSTAEKEIYLVYDAKENKENKDIKEEDFLNTKDISKILGVNKESLFLVDNLALPFNHYASNGSNASNGSSVSNRRSGSSMKKDECRGYYYDIKEKTFHFNKILDLNSNKNIYYPKTIYSRDYSICKLNDYKFIRINFNWFKQEQSNDICKHLGFAKDGIVFIPALQSSFNKLSKNPNCHLFEDKINLEVGYNDALLFQIKSLLTCKERIKYWSESNIIKNYNKFEELLNLYEKSKFLYSCFFDNSFNDVIENYYDKAKKELDKIDTDTDFSMYDFRNNDHYKKLFMYYYKNNDTGVGDELDKEIEKFHNDIMKKYKDFACVLY